MEKKNVFAVLNAINCNNHTEKKNGLTYLSWAWAWAEVKKNFPDAYYTIYEDASGRNYHNDGRTCWVKTGVTIQDIEYIEYLPVMDFKNNSISLERVTSFDVNKAIQRSLTKACARHGLGLYIYAGEDLPETPATYEEPREYKAAPVKSDNVNQVHERKQKYAEAQIEIDNAQTADDVMKIYNKWKESGMLYKEDLDILHAEAGKKYKSLIAA